MKRKNKTIFFEKKYGVHIDDFKTTEEIDDFLEKKLKRKLKIKDIHMRIWRNINDLKKSDDCD
jgi:hypothetical protein